MGTLGKLFAMELHNYGTLISDITNAASKELTIESELKKLAEVWKGQKFEIFKYMKGTVDRGWILKSTEEVVQLLEDMSLNLQSMMASRFVKPFIDEVSSWEGKLSLIGESIEVWMFVQRKWMYLESIFVGSDDIRHQLPQGEGLGVHVEGLPRHIHELLPVPLAERVAFQVLDQGQTVLERVDLVLYGFKNGHEAHLALQDGELLQDGFGGRDDLRDVQLGPEDPAEALKVVCVLLVPVE